MTNEEYLEYWKCLSADELIIRCGLYIARIAQLEEALRLARNALSETAIRAGTQYDWNADPDKITLLQGEAFSKMDSTCYVRELPDTKDPEPMSYRSSIR